MAELAWVTEQVEASACVCCHTNRASKNGSSDWNIEEGPIWTDTVSDLGLAILAGYADRMDTFFRSNPGMSSRIAHHLEFPDYSGDELLQIAER